jgi:divalent metal cation (Fe/Co/Zn/Cd) transporter
MGLLFISIIPFALSGIPLSQAGLSTGLYFGGSGLAGAIASRLLQPNHPLTPWNAFGWAIACFFLTYGWLNMTRKWGIGSGK